MVISPGGVGLQQDVEKVLSGAFSTTQAENALFRLTQKIPCIMGQ
ncbi:MAG: hypothetical protein AB7T15_09345 [Desulfuromonas sp.]|jgi:hypothetical protein|nr:hypothetical protein [Desulfuromonas thiophila]MDY0398314.1 hypothetical protein [Desulfuromonas thiophila]